MNSKVIKLKLTTYQIHILLFKSKGALSFYCTGQACLINIKNSILWTQKGSNLRPPDYESGALTN